MRYRKFDGATAAMLAPAEIVKAGPAPDELTGRPARCASEFHGGQEQAVVWGTFLNSKIQPGRPDTGNVGYCAKCARLLHLVGWFRPGEDQTIPGEE